MSRAKKETISIKQAKPSRVAVGKEAKCNSITTTVCFFFLLYRPVMLMSYSTLKAPQRSMLQHLNVRSTVENRFLTQTSNTCTQCFNV